jgi:isoleucyl-tRNA synthetase
MGLEVMDKIRILFNRNDKELVNKAIESHREYICTETQANSLEFQDGEKLPNELEMEDTSLWFGIEKF